MELVRKLIAQGICSTCFFETDVLDGLYTSLCWEGAADVHIYELNPCVNTPEIAETAFASVRALGFPDVIGNFLCSSVLNYMNDFVVA